MPRMTAALWGALLVAVCICMEPTAALASPGVEFGVKTFTMSATNEAGAPYTQAGGHPYELTTTIELNTETNTEGREAPVRDPREIAVNPPPGLIGEVPTTPRCPLALFDLSATLCPASTQVGTVETFTTSTVPWVDGVYNLQPVAGHAASFGLTTPVGERYVLTGGVLTGEGYGLTIEDAGIPAVGLYKLKVTLWGVPAEPSHNPQRGQDCAILGPGPGEEFCQGGEESSGDLPTPFLTMPTDCAAGSLTATMEADSWEEPGMLDANGRPDLGGGHWKTAAATMPAVTGCNLLAFEPNVKVTPETTQAGAPVGLDFGLRVPQTDSPSLSATPHVKDVTVALPAGMVISPSSANGLAACSDEQFALSSSEPGVCPRESEVGTVQIVTPALPEQLVGDVFLGSPLCDPCTPVDAQDGHMVRLFVQAIAEGESGVIVKLEGTGSINQQTSQITATFKENPQLPFSELHMRLGGGPRATLANPNICGPATTSADLTPWSAPGVTPEGVQVAGTPDATRSSSYQVTGCLAPQFNPTFTAGMTNNQAGAFSPFTLAFGRGDADEFFGGLSMQLAPGLSGMLSKVSLCKEPQASQGTCGPESVIGHTQVLTGPGAEPFLVTGGQVFITEGYKGAPFGLSIVVPAKAGPYTLAGTTGAGTVVVRGAINIDPHTAALTVTSDPLPASLDGIPLQLKIVNVTIDRPEFTFNPTDCNKLAITGNLSSLEGASVAEPSSFQVTNCAALAFKPGFAASTSAKSSKADGASLTVKLTYPNTPQGTEANIAKVKVDLPKQLPSRLTTLQKACVAAVFNANPAGCPAASNVGTATAITLIFSHPLTGPAYFVSHGGEAFPDLEIVLQGEGVKLILDGKTDIKKGITSSTFRTVPDAPISSFELKLPTGPYSILGTNLPTSAKYSLCGQKLAMPTAFVGQNGAEIHESTPIAVTGCKPAITVVKRSVKGATATISVSVPAAGKLVATGKGLSKASGKASKAGTVTVKLTLTKGEAAFLARHRGRRLKAKIDLRFTPKKGAKLKTTTTVLIG